MKKEGDFIADLYFETTKNNLPNARKGKEKNIGSALSKDAFRHIYTSEDLKPHPYGVLVPNL